MHIGTFENFTTCYLALIENVYNAPQYISAPRGQKIKEVLGATFTISDARQRLPYVAGRKFSLTYLVAELTWYLSGNNKTEWISKYSSFWKDITDDGTTANSAYGSRLFLPHDSIASSRFVQWDYVVEELRRDPDSRRAIMHLRVPADSIDAKLDVPCTLALQFFIRDNKLHQIAMMRSSDIIFGIAYDVPAFTMFQEILANELGVAVGSYTHMSNSLHIYERHFDMAARILKRENFESSMAWGRKRARTNADICAISTGSSLSKIRSTIINDLIEFEAVISSETDDIKILKLVNAFQAPDFWKDYAIVFAAKRLKDLNFRPQYKQLMKNLSNSEYDFYVRKL
ncbi:MAG: thymidylate synthase [Rhodobacteraceae bacterium]|nr:thymidylate synthase [Paracoccaceae bacterium]